MISDAIFNGHGSINGVMLTGQSWAVGAVSSSGQVALTTTPKSRALCFQRAQRDGGSGITGIDNLRSIGPLREATFVENGGSWAETPLSGFAAQLEWMLRQPYHLILGNWGRGSAAYSVLAKGTATYARGQLMARMMRQAFRNCNFRAMLAFHGGSDATSATYQTDMRQWQLDFETDVNAMYGVSKTIPWFVVQPPMGNNGSGALVGVVGLLEEHKVNLTKTVLVGPTYFLPVGADGIHLTSEGYRKIGEYFAVAYYQHMIQGLQWSPIRPISISRVANIVTLSFATASSNLVLDTTNVSNPGNYGFEWNDDSGKVITAVRTIGTTVEVTLNGTPTINANTKIRYAYTSQAGANIAGPQQGVRGCLRDSSPIVGILSQEPLYNWCVAFNETVT